MSANTNLSPLRSLISTDALRLLFLAVLCLGMAAPAPAQEDASSDELSGFEKIDGTKLKPATLSHDATVKMDGRSRELSSTQTVVKTTTAGTRTWTLVSRIETPRGTSTDSLIVDRSFRFRGTAG